MKKKIVFILLSGALILPLSACGSATEPEETEDELSVSAEVPLEATELHIYDNAEIIDVMNGNQTEKVGEMSLIEADSEDITLDVLTDWYFNYVEESEYNYCLILYTDIDNTGCYAVSGMVEENVTLEPNDSGLYMLSGTSNEIMYIPSDGELVEYKSEE